MKKLLVGIFMMGSLGLTNLNAISNQEITGKYGLVEGNENKNLDIMLDKKKETTTGTKILYVLGSVGIIYLVTQVVLSLQASAMVHNISNRNY